MKARRWLWRSAWAPVLLLAVPMTAVHAQSGLRAPVPSIAPRDRNGPIGSLRPPSLAVRGSGSPTARVPGLLAVPRQTAAAPSALLTGSLMGTIARLNTYRTFELAREMSASLDVRRRSVGLKFTLRM